MQPHVKRRLQKRLAQWGHTNPSVNPADLTNYLFTAAKHLSPQPTRAEMNQFVAAERRASRPTKGSIRDPGISTAPFLGCGFVVGLGPRTFANPKVRS